MIGYDFTVIPYDEANEARILGTSTNVVRLNARDWYSDDAAQFDMHIEAYTHHMGNKVAIRTNSWLMDSSRNQ